VFFMLFSFWTVLFMFSGVLNGIFLLGGVIFSFIVSLFVTKVKLYNERSEFSCLQVGFYKLLLRNVFGSLGESIYLAFQFLKIENNLIPIIDYVLIDNENTIQNALLCGIMNINCGILSCVIKNQCLMIHSLNELFFTPNQLYFLNIDIKRINDDNVV
jgi:hypothetical protein